jgi:hypothetical protein
MVSVFFAILFGLLAAFFRKLPIVSSGLPGGTKFPEGLIFPGRVVLGLLSAFCVLSTSYVNIGENETGHKVKVYGYGSLEPGKVIAAHGEKGPQADIIQPGFHISPLLNVLNKVETFPMLEIQDGKYAFIVAKDGASLRDGQTYADPVPAEVFKGYITDAEKFLANSGVMGPQTNVLSPGRYRYNHYLFDFEIGEVTDIPKGFVAVIKSNVRGPVNMGNLVVTEAPKDCTPAYDNKQVNRGALSVPLVPVGCVGIWKTALNPGKYYINEKVYKVTPIDTRVQTWEYKGGYKKRTIDLEVDSQGKLIQHPHEDDIPKPAEAVDTAVFAKIEGWDVPLELRALVQVTPENAPFVVASVGGLVEVESRILTPAIRSVVRDVLGGGFIKVDVPVLDADRKPVFDERGQKKTIVSKRVIQVLDLIENRPTLEENVRDVIQVEGMKAGVEIKEIRFGEPIIPPDLFIAKRREQLAQQLTKAYVQEQLAQTQRITTEQARATADQQPELVKSQIKNQQSVLEAEAAKNLGQGEKDRLDLIAQGQKMQAQVLGEDRVVTLRKYELLVDRVFGFLDKNPEVLTTALTNAQKFVPERVFTLGDGGANSLPAAAGILGDLLGTSPVKPVPSPVKKEKSE